MMLFRRFALLLAFTGRAAAADLHVPTDHATIQGAIDAASDGDAVLVAPGTWREAIDFHGKAIEVRGEAGADATILDGTGLGTVVRMTSGEGPLTVLRGFTIRNRSLDIGEVGLLCQGSSPRVEACRFRELDLVAPDCLVNVYGLAARCSGGAPAFTGCAFEDDLVSFPCIKGQLHGIALAALDGAAPRLESCTVVRQRVALDDPSSFALFATGASLVLRDCVVEDNDRGGISVSNGALDAERCRIRGNRAGPGIALSGPPALQSRLVQVEVTGNDQAGLSLAFQPSAKIARSTFTGNGKASASAKEIDAIFFSGSLVIEDTIAWGKGLSPFLTAATTTVRYSDVKGGFAGTGNQSADPLFVDEAEGDVHLGPGSPCIDAGDPAGPADPDGTPPDQGAHPYEPWHSIEAGPAGTLTGSGSLHPNSAFTITLTGAPARRAFALVFGDTTIASPLPGGLLVVAPQAVILGFATDASGAWSMTDRWPATAPPATTIALQALFPLAPQPLPSDGLVGTSP